MRKVVTASLSLAALVGIGGAFQTPTKAAPVEWTNTSGGTFSDGANWGDGAGSAPGSADSATFDKTDTYQVSFDSDATNTDLAVIGGTVTFNLGGKTYTQTGQLTVKNTNALLNIRNGTLASRYVRMGASAASAGPAVINVSGLGSQWNINGTSTAESAIGYTGNGKLQISDQGAVSVTSTAANTKFVVGDYGTGDININSKGTMSTDKNVLFFIGTHGHLGNVTVQDDGSTLTASQYIYVGSAGQGTLTIQNKGQVSTSNIFAGYAAGGTGQITIQSGGDLSVGAAYIGGQWSLPQAPGTLTVGDNGTVEATAASGVRVYNLGTVELQGDGTISTPKLDVQGGKVSVEGTNNDIVGNAVFTTYTDGDNVTTDPTLMFTLAGPTPGGGQGLLSVSGALTLGGTLNVSLAGGFTPVLGDTFDLLDWGNLAGTFTTISLPTLSDPQLTWYQGDLYTDGTITVAAVPEPGALGLLAAGGLALLARRRR